MSRIPDDEETTTIGKANVTFRLFVDQEQLDPRRNASAWGPSEKCSSCKGEGCRACDDEGSADAQYLRSILNRLARGDVWAWASVGVECIIRLPGNVMVSDTVWVGGCTYDDLEDWKESLWDEMKEEAYHQARAALARMEEDARDARKKARIAARYLKTLPVSLPVKEAA